MSGQQSHVRTLTARTSEVSYRCWSGGWCDVNFNHHNDRFLRSTEERGGRRYCSKTAMIKLHIHSFSLDENLNIPVRVCARYRPVSLSVSPPHSPPLLQNPSCFIRNRRSKPEKTCFHRVLMKQGCSKMFSFLKTTSSNKLEQLWLYSL